MSDEPAVKITLADIYKQGQETQERVGKLEHKVDNFVQVNERLDSHKADIAGHDSRIRKLEIQIAAQWVIVGLVTTGIGAMLSKFFAG